MEKKMKRIKKVKLEVKKFTFEAWWGIEWGKAHRIFWAFPVLTITIETDIDDIPF